MPYLRSAILWLLTSLFVFASTHAEAFAQTITVSTASRTKSTKTKVHQVAEGQTLGAIAKRYQVTVDALCKANGIKRTDPIRPGQRLVIPSGEPFDDPPDTARQAGRRVTYDQVADARQRVEMQQGMQKLDVPRVPGMSGPLAAYYYEPTGSGRLGLRPVIMVLHGRGGNASAFCSRWAPVARPLGWLICPSAPHPCADGTSWENDWVAGRTIVNATLAALRGKHGRRVQLYGNTLVGFSEGAFVAMNVGVRDPRTFNRWLILAAEDRYWGAAAPQLVDRARGSLRRVFLITGQLDGVYEGTLRTQGRLQRAKVPVSLLDPSDMGHEVALESRQGMYREALSWLQQ